MIPFKKEFSLEQRRTEFQKILSKYPSKTPVVVYPVNDKTPDIDRHKFLVPSDVTMGQFICIIRKRIKLDSDSALFFFINNKLHPMTSLISQIYKDNKDEDLGLYIVYSSESVFG